MRAMVKPNTAVPTDAYVPILKGKMAEYGALESCASDRLVPLVEVTSPDTAHKAIVKAWPHADDVIWVHSLNFGDLDEAHFASAVEDLFDNLRSGVIALPVITIDEEPDTIATIRRIISTDQRGVVLRVDAEEVLDDASNTAANIESTLRELGIGVAQADIVLDAGLLDGPATVQAAVAGQCLALLPSLADWRTVVVAFSGFPIPLSQVVPRSSVRAVPRTGAAAFAATARVSPRPIVFADYTLGTPSYDSVPFTPIPNIRYAVDGDWMIHRAQERKAPGPQFRALAAAIVEAPYFSGPAFSPGDRQISDTASGASGPGNPTTHLRAGISRHVHVVLERLATLGEP